MHTASNSISKQHISNLHQYLSMGISWLPTGLAVILVCIFQRLSQATAGSVVTNLPGFHGPLPFSLETGYVTVEEENGAEMFYYFVESEGNPSEDPLLVWLAGGIRCSALHPLSFQMGPVRFVKIPYNGSLPQLVTHKYSYTKVASVIFPDSPVGAGFSYSSNPKGYDIDDLIAGMQVAKFIRKWLVEHPQYLSNPLYIGGHSYGGKRTAYIAELISEGIEAGQKPPLNFKGYVIGNPGTGEWFDSGFFAQFAHGMGIISDQLYESARQNCNGEYNRSPNKVCAETLAAVNNSLSETYASNILEPNCNTGAKSRSEYVDGTTKRYLTEEDKISLLQPSEVNSFQCRSDAYTLQHYWANENRTRDALHIKKGTVEEWQRCNADLPFRENLPGTLQFHHNLTKKGYRALVYSGDHDRVIPFLSTQAWVRSLNFSIVENWRAWHVAGQAAGFTITYSNNMTFATVKGAGHAAPEYKPKECLALLRRWFSHKPL